MNPHNKKTIEEMQQLAISNSGKCLSKEYINITTKLEWKCLVGHRWMSTPQNVRDGRWCISCGRRKSKLNKIIQIIESKGGKCLTDSYYNQNSLISVRCQNGHIWTTKYLYLQRGTWCPKCTLKNVKEDQCRFILEQLTGYKFPTNREILGNKQHLDGYCEELNLAFEYDGEHHFKLVTQFHDNRTNLKYRQNKDLIKNELCKSMGINLIRISYLESNNLENYIKNKLLNFGLTTSNTINWANFSYCSKLNQCKKYAESKNIKCLSNVYNSNREKMQWQCKCGYTWLSSWASFRELKSFCPKCDGRNSKKCIYHNRYTNYKTKYTLDDMAKIAKNRGGQCLSSSYINCDTKLFWRCGNCKNEWIATPTSIINNQSWCSICSINKRRSMSIIDLQNLAEKKNGLCLSKEYKRLDEKITWQCKKNHIWEAIPANIRKGQWCPYCSGNIKTIEDMKIMASHNNGLCLSDKYEGVHVKLLWRCKKNHEWMATPNTIKRNIWCRKCELSNRHDTKI